MNNNENENFKNIKDIDGFNIIKHIGKGSFSNVYLCKAELDSLMDGEIYNLEYEKFFIIKEININVLVEKYMSNSKSEYRFQKMPQTKGNSNVSVNITPYTNRNTNIMIPSKSNERDYYYYKLKGLIESEIDILHMLSHKSIIQFNTYMQSNYIYYLNLEYCDKGDVYYILKNENEEITSEFITEFTKQTSDGISYMHNNNIIHRDIKLQNILVKTNDGIDKKNEFKYIFKISDFGFSCYDMQSLRKNNELYDLDEMLCKKYYKLCGTPYFMAPEIVLNMNKLENFTFYDENKKIHLSEFYDKRIDVWSYGICLYELITNRMPFPNIKNFRDLEKLYKKEDIQIFIDSKLEIVKDPTFNSILYMALKINAETRCYIYQISEKINKSKNIIVNKINIKKSNEESSSSFLNVIKHIVSNPINTLNNTLSSLNNGSSTVIQNMNDTNKQIELDLENESKYLINSWEEINNSSSLMLKLSVQKGFMSWLLKK